MILDPPNKKLKNNEQQTLNGRTKLMNSKVTVMEINVYNSR